MMPPRTCATPKRNSRRPRRSSRDSKRSSTASLLDRPAELLIGRQLPVRCGAQPPFAVLQLEPLEPEIVSGRGGAESEGLLERARRGVERRDLGGGRRARDVEPFLPARRAGRPCHFPPRRDALIRARQHGLSAEL